MSRRTLIEWTWECGLDRFTTVAYDKDTAFERACEEAAVRGFSDCPLRCIDSAPFDATGGDGVED